MGHRSRSIACVVVTLALVAGAFGALAGGAAGLPSPEVPNIPNVPLPKPEQTATFDVVVEGTATDKLVSRLEGTDSACLVDEQGTVEDATTYRRGKGVALQFDRYGRTVVVHRVGRKFDASLAVQVKTKRTASGGSRFSPTLPNVECPQPYELSTNPDCGKTFGRPGAMLLSYLHGHLGLAISSKTTSARPLKDECGNDPQTGISNQFGLAWPLAPKLEASPGAPLQQIFGRKHVIVVSLSSSDVGRPETRLNETPSGVLHGKTTETAFNRATVRLIRR